MTTRNGGQRDEYHPNRSVHRERFYTGGDAHQALRSAADDAQRHLPSHAATMDAARRGERWAMDDLGDYD